MSHNSKEIEQKVKTIRNFSDISFVYQLLLAYGKPKASITRLQQGTYNLSKVEGELYWKNTLFFKQVTVRGVENLLQIIDDISHNKELLHHNPRFIIITNYKDLLAIDTRDNTSLNIPIDTIAKHYDFFLPWAGMEKSVAAVENEADVKAAERMAVLYDEIIRTNPVYGHDAISIDYLNIFFSRLLFCFFAEDTKIFPKQLFTGSLAQHTQLDGSDTDQFFADIFRVMNQPEGKRGDVSAYLDAFPYVNGKLFDRKLTIPKFSAKARRLLMECGELNWSHINPDIFGSMIQAVVHPGDRASLGMHYTSVENIMKVINPLFLENLNQEYRDCNGNKTKLAKLHKRITEIKIFDPACGSGNFLIISYKELRKLENKILNDLYHNGGKVVPSMIKLENFYGIEIDGFAHEIAILSLWLAKHQMNIAYDTMFGTTSKLIPLKDVGNIVCGNAATLDWQKVCPNVPNYKNLVTKPKQTKLIADEVVQQELITDSDLSKPAYDEIYLVGNPPYLGSRNQKAVHKDDLKLVSPNYKSLDYIAIWFLKGSAYIKNSRAELAFVSTNSICQGEQVALIWPEILRENEIGFAYTSFKWTNHAKANAGVICVIINVRPKSSKEKRIYSDNKYQIANMINGYLANASETYIVRRSKPISQNLPVITYGSMLNDGGNLILSDREKHELVSSYPKASKFIKRFIGSVELLHSLSRWCIYIDDIDLIEAVQIEPIKRRLENVIEHRSSSSEESTKKLALTPNHFYYFAHKNTQSIIVPRVSSEKREYIPIDYLTQDTIISDSANAIYDAQSWVFGLISSRLHMTWVRAVAGRLKTDYRYSSAIVYNNFPVPNLSDKQKSAITDHVMEVLQARQNHSELTLAQMYDPDHMPEDLREAHKGLDLVVELCYRSKPFKSDEERLSYLFKEYEKMVAIEKEAHAKSS